MSYNDQSPTHLKLNKSILSKCNTNAKALYTQIINTKPLLPTFLEGTHSKTNFIDGKICKIYILGIKIHNLLMADINNRPPWFNYPESGYSLLASKKQLNRRKTISVTAIRKEFRGKINFMLNRSDVVHKGYLKRVFICMNNIRTHSPHKPSGPLSLLVSIS